MAGRKKGGGGPGHGTGVWPADHPGQRGDAQARGCRPDTESGGGKIRGRVCDSAEYRPL